MNKTLIRLTVFPVVLLVGGFRLVSLLQASPAEAEANETTPVASIYSGTAVRSQVDFLKLRALQNKAASPQILALTDGDVDWLLHARNAVNANKPYAAATARARPLEVLLRAQLSPAQKEKVFRAVLPDLQSRDKWGATVDRIRACDALETLHDKRGIPYLLPLLHYPDARVRARAERALQSLGDAR